MIFQMLNWKMNYRYQCRGICRGQENAKFLIFGLDESRILIGKNQYTARIEFSHFAIYNSLILQKPIQYQYIIHNSTKVCYIERNL